MLKYDQIFWIFFTPHMLTMLRQDPDRSYQKRRSAVGFRKKQFASNSHAEAFYPTKLNLYTEAPTAEVAYFHIPFLCVC